MVTVAQERPHVFRMGHRLTRAIYVGQSWLPDNLSWSEFWSPNRPDLNLLDYYVQSVVARIANKILMFRRRRVRGAFQMVDLNCEIYSYPFIQYACNYKNEHYIVTVYLHIFATSLIDEALSNENKNAEGLITMTNEGISFS